MLHREAPSIPTGLRSCVSDLGESAEVLWWVGYLARQACVNDLWIYGSSSCLHASCAFHIKKIYLLRVKSVSSQPWR